MEFGFYKFGLMAEHEDPELFVEKVPFVKGLAGLGPEIKSVQGVATIEAAFTKYLLLGYVAGHNARCARMFVSDEPSETHAGIGRIRLSVQDRRVNRKKKAKEKEG